MPPLTAANVCNAVQMLAFPRLSVHVPDPVIAPPLNPVPQVTLVTVPAPPATQDVLPLPSVCRMLVLEPLVPGVRKVVLPAIGLGPKVVLPEVDPGIAISVAYAGRAKHENKSNAARRFI